MTTIITDPKAIRLVRLSAIERGLELEIKTGMRHSHNMTLRAAQQETGKRTRKACLAAIKKIKAKEEKELTNAQ